MLIPSHGVCSKCHMIQRISKQAKKTGAAIALLSAEMVLILVIFVLALFALAYLIRNVIVLHRTGFDQKVFAYLQNHISPENNSLMLFFTFLGTHKFLIPANLVLIAYFVFIQKRKWYAIKIPAIALSSLALMFGLKHFFHRPRPEVPLIFKAEGLSFPSGHALFSVTFYGLLVYIIYHSVENKTVKWILIIFLLLLMPVIGFSRVYLRVHYASDVIAGFCVGFIWLVLTIWFLNQIEAYTRKNLDKAVQQ